MRRSLNDLNNELERLANQFDALVRKKLGDIQEAVDDFIFTEEQENAWLNAVPTFTKRIYTPLPTKRRLRVTLRNNIYNGLLLKVTN